MFMERLFWFFEPSWLLGREGPPSGRLGSGSAAPASLGSHIVQSLRSKVQHFIGFGL